jgi:hypothetical protein
MARVIFAHSQAGDTGEAHRRTLVAAVKARAALEVVVYMDTAAVTGATMRAWLSQFRTPGWSKGTLVVVDATAVAEPIGVMDAIHGALPWLPPCLGFLVLVPLVPVTCVFCPCHDDVLSDSDSGSGDSE